MAESGGKRKEGGIRTWTETPAGEESLTGTETLPEEESWKETVSEEEKQTGTGIATEVERQREIMTEEEETPKGREMVTGDRLTDTRMVKDEEKQTEAVHESKNVVITNVVLSQESHLPPNGS